ncbi:MAG: S1C family serine protease [Candidatus Buchananbacteria bacterium]
MKIIDRLLKKEKGRVVSQTVILAMIFGFIAGVVGQIVSDVYIDPYGQNYNLSGAENDITPVIPELKKVKKFIGIQQDFEVNSSVVKVYPTLAGIYYKKAAGTDQLKRVYLANEILASGSVLTSDGWILTQGQVFNNSKKEQLAVVYSGKVYDASQLIFDRATGVTFIKIAGSNFPVISLGDSDEATTGQLALSLNYFGDTLVSNIKDKRYQKISKDDDLVVSSESNFMPILLSDSFKNNFVGSPLVNLSGEMIGIVSEAGKDSQFLTVVPVNQFRNVILDVLRSGVIKRPYLGLNYLDLTLAVGLDSALTQNQKTGILIWQSPKANSPAAAADLKANDIILTIDDQSLDANTNLTDILNQYQPNDEVVLNVLRQGKSLKVKVKLGTMSK